MMTNALAKKLLHIQEEAKKDPSYRTLLQEYEALDRQMMVAILSMPPEHRNLVLDYIGVIHAIHRMQYELFCKDA